MGPVDAAKHHWFTGSGHGARRAAGGGRAQWYRNRWVRSAAVVEALGEDVAGRELAGANNTHVIGHAGRTWALVEAGSPPVELTDELDTLGVNAFFGTLADRGFSAHPKVDPDTGDLHAMCYQLAGVGRSSAVRARRQRRPRRAHGEHSGARHADGARHEPHAELRRRLRLAGDGQSRDGDGGFELSVCVERRLSAARRSVAAQWQRERHHLGRCRRRVTSSIR